MNSRKRNTLFASPLSIFIVTSIFILSALSGCGGSSNNADQPNNRTSDGEGTAAEVIESSENNEASDQPPLQENQENLKEVEAEKWTVLIYLMGDTDLEEFALTDIVEMSEVPTSENVDIVVLFDRSDIYSEESVLNLENFSDTKLLQVKNGSLHILEDQLGERNLGDAGTLAEFIEYGFTRFPAERTALILWDHGAGWPGMGPDEGNEFDILDLQEISNGIEAGLENAGIDKLDLVGFDACLMGTFEVALAMAEHADVMVASQELEPGHGWDWQALEILTSNSSVDAKTLGLAIANGYEQHAIDNETETEITLSVIDLTRIGVVDQALKALEEPLVSESESLAPKLGLAQSTSLRIGKNPDPSLDAQMIDLGNLAEELGKIEPELLDLTNSLVTAIDDVVIGHVSGPATKASTGLAVYFPELGQYSDQGYFDLEGISSWQNILTSYFQAQQNIPEEEQARFLTEQYPAEYTLDATEGLVITAQFDLAAQDNLTEAVIYYGLPEEDGSILFLGEEPAVFANDGSGLAQGLYDLTVLTMSDREDTVYAYTQLYHDEESSVSFLDIPLTYVPPGDFEGDETFLDVVLSITLDSETADVLSEIYYSIDQTGQWGELVADPEGLIYPVFLLQNTDYSFEWVEINEVGLWADIPNLSYSFEPLESGMEFVAELWVFDYGGNSDYVYVEDIIP